MTYVGLEGIAASCIQVVAKGIAAALAQKVFPLPSALAPAPTLPRGHATSRRRVASAALVRLPLIQQ